MLINHGNDNAKYQVCHCTRWVWVKLGQPKTRDAEYSPSSNQTLQEKICVHTFCRCVFFVSENHVEMVAFQLLCSLTGVYPLVN